MSGACAGMGTVCNPNPEPVDSLVPFETSLCASVGLASGVGPYS